MRLLLKRLLRWLLMGISSKWLPTEVVKGALKESGPSLLPAAKSQNSMYGPGNGFFRALRTRAQGLSLSGVSLLHHHGCFFMCSGARLPAFDSCLSP